MPKEDERRKELTQKEIEAEKFRTFFSTSVAQVPEAMSRREEEETPPKRGLFGGLFHREKPEPETKEPAERGLELPPTGEIVLGDIHAQLLHHIRQLRLLRLVIKLVHITVAHGDQHAMHESFACFVVLLSRALGIGDGLFDIRAHDGHCESVDADRRQ